MELCQNEWMFNLFKKKKYQTKILPEITGSAHGITVTFSDFPVRALESDPEKLFEFHTDFNTELLNAVYDRMGDLEIFVKRARTHPVTFSLKTSQSPSFHISISLNVDKAKDYFDEELPDAIIDIFEKYNIKR
jgi:hypothetical protein